MTEDGPRGLLVVREWVLEFQRAVGQSQEIIGQGVP